MLAAALGSLTVSVITARSLGAWHMGVYSFAVWVAGTVAALSSLGLPDAIAKYVAEHKCTGKDALAAEIARRILATQILASVAFFLVGAALWSALDRSHLPQILLALATVVPIATQQVLLALMEGEQRFHLQFIATVGGAVLQIVTVSIFAARHASLLGFLLANLLSCSASTGLTYLLCRPMLRPGVVQAFSPDTVKQIRGFSMSVYAVWLLNLIVFDKSELFFLRIFRSPAELAYYSIAFALAARLAGAGDSVSYALFPIFVTRYSLGGPEGLREAYSRSVRYLQLLLAPVFFWLLPLAPRLIVAFYGKAYAGAAPVLQVLLGTALVGMTMTISSSAVYSMGRQRSLLRLMLLASMLNLVLDLLFVPRQGPLGAALANGFSQAFAACGLVAVLRKEMPGSFPVLETFKIYLAALVSCAPILYCELVLHGGILLLCAAVAVSLLLYAGLLGCLRAVGRDEFEAFGSSFLTLVFRKAA